MRVRAVADSTRQGPAIDTTDDRARLTRVRELNSTRQGSRGSDRAAGDDWAVGGLGGLGLGA